MKKLFPLFFLCLSFSVQYSLAQDNVGIGTVSPDQSAVLDISAFDKGILIPRLSTLQRLAVASPATGLLVFDTDFNNFWYFDGTIWVQAIGPQGPQGPAGLAGVTGATGAAGPTGATGQDGIAGTNGTTGPQGPTGSQGVAGVAGATGATGQDGTNGTNGAQGPTGPQGIAGTDGTNGLQGPTGPQGIPGLNGTAVALPTGMIMMWSGSVATIPTGWALCNGTNGTPNLQDRFVVGAGSTYTPGTTGGAATVALTTAQMPTHGHDYRDRYFAEGTIYTSAAHGIFSETHTAANFRGSGDTDNDNDYFNYVNKTTSNQGSGSAHENRPPYYALCYVMKL